MSAWFYLFALVFAYFWLTGRLFAGVMLFAFMRYLAESSYVSAHFLDYYAEVVSISFGPWMLWQVWKAHLARLEARKDVAFGEWAGKTTWNLSRRD
ncbi:hypothetical protein J2D73_14230 [Acetobacter sacchari]|uniref:Uncharacterized protein n=1 Tax=Acetobacter sacchari TaxID=2661687 RepID=A0ABS3LYE7_9PROT|nr:hypothetical protein [Acetobacter sacchari]MBO1360944.1 hypothetical protein [Acetobacter sacchari]